jgi:hypothetical protein
VRRENLSVIYPLDQRSGGTAYLEGLGDFFGFFGALKKGSFLGRAPKNSGGI